jgi:hypothetical protein
MYKKHISEIDGSENFFNIEKEFWFNSESPEYENLLEWISEGNEINS